jgi:soluble lytic murein transglycosylase-like protein
MVISMNNTYIDLDELGNVIVYDKKHTLSNDQVKAFINYLCQNKIKFTFRGSNLIINQKTIIINYQNLLAKEELKPLIKEYQKHKVNRSNQNAGKLVIGTSALCMAMLASSLMVKPVKAEPKENKPVIDEPIPKTNSYYVDAQSDKETELKIMQEAKAAAQKKLKEKEAAASALDLDLSNIVYEDKSNADEINYVKKNYDDVISKIAPEYGFNSQLIEAIGAQERVKHSDIPDTGGAVGLMQIQVSVHYSGSQLPITKFSNNQTKKVNFTFNFDDYKTLDGNINAGCALLRYYNDEFNGNLIATLCAYNAGDSQVSYAIKRYAKENNLSYNAVLNNYNNLAWLDTAYFPNKEYAANVLRYYQNDKLSYYILNNEKEYAKTNFNLKTQKDIKEVASLK